MHRSLLALALLFGCADKSVESGEAVDQDGDGFDATVDCDDADAAVHPDAVEVDDDIDNDCDGVADEYMSLYDGDGDGYSAAAGDCDDADASVSPDASEVPEDGLDNDCDDLTDETGEQEDYDGDGYSEDQGDCDEEDPEISPGAEELEDQIDNDCDGATDEGTRLYDDDGDGYSENFGDCDDTNAAVYPAAPDEPYDGVDSNCGYDDDFDADDDGYTAAEYDGDDCDDRDAAANPDAVETCNGLDDNCDGGIDEALTGLEESCPGDSCLLIFSGTSGLADGLYWVDPLGSGAREVYCDMSGGGWTLVARATNAGGVAENGTLSDGEETGTLPITPDSTGNNKLSDDLINALRIGALPNDLKVVVQVGGETLGESWHPQDCVLQTGVAVDADDPCNASTTGGADDLDYTQSLTDATLGRWEVDDALGYLWGAPGVQLGPVEGGTDHEGALPDPYCTWIDERVCPVESAIEIWAY